MPRFDFDKALRRKAERHTKLVERRNRRLKDGNGVYYGSGPFGPNQVPVLWGLPAAVTPVITATNALVGAFASCAQRFTRRGATVTMSNSHSDYFTKRLVAILAEMREALAIYRPGAFGKVTGLN